MRSNVRVYQRKIIERRRKRALFFSATLLILAGLVTWGLSWLSGIEAMKITTIRIEGAERLKESDLAALAEQAMQDDVLGLFSRKNILLYPSEKVAAEIREMPLVKEVRVKKKGLHEIAVIVRERKEEARFCLPEADGISNCFSLDADGFVFNPIELTRSDMSLIYRDPAVEDPFGKQFLSPEVFRNLQFFAQQLSATGAVPREIEFGDGGYLTLTFDGGGRLIMNMSDDLSAVLSNFTTLISNTSIAPSPADFLSKLEYMYLDAGNKIFLKQKE